MSHTYYLNPTPQTVHWGHFNASIPAVLQVESGDEVVIDTFSGGMSEVADPSLFRPEHRLIVDTVPQIMGPHILTGPVHVKGAEPGDTLEVRILDIELTTDWGWNIIRPLKGALPEDFPNLSRRVIPIDRQTNVARLPWGVDVPLRPFFGIIGVAPPPAYGLVSSVEPREYGGNIDNKEFIPGTSLFLPVFVPGANLSVGDGHAVQGDGEVCLTALETCLKGRFQVIVHKQSLNFPRAITPTHYISMGMDVDLDDAAKQALRNMIKWLTEIKPWTAEEAYVFCSLACDLHVTQLVDGNKGIHAMVSRSVIGL
ncbi:MAG: acetamidase/formamidase family protein [Burkholderiales bacterium]|nr:acetamidase/formamidase family protein [Burkholderiales bacterium]